VHALILKPGREKSLKRRHPWVFSGAVAKVQGNPDAGDTVEIRSATGERLAIAAYSPKSQIVARVWDWKEVPIDQDFFHKRIAQAVAQRRVLLDQPDTGAMRLVHGESDGLPGVVADRYADTVVLQLTSAGAERWREVIADKLLEVSGASRIWERSDAEVRALARGRDVLDGFCYSGGFALNACAGGAKSVTAVDSSAEALALARSNAERNKLAPAEWLEGDVFQLLRRFRDQGRNFDLVVLDPPKFAPTAAHAAKAARAYKDINLLAFKLLRPGGLLVTFSCSGGVSADLFQKIVAGAALDAGVQAQIIERLGPGADHPVALNFPEGDYLKGLVCRVAGG